MTSSFKPLRTKFRENLNKNEHFFMQDLFLNIIYKSPAIFLGLSVLIHIY